MSSKKIKVAQIIASVAEGGIEMMIMNLYRNIDHDKVEFHFLVPNTSLIINAQEIESYGGKVTIVPSIKRYFKYKKALKTIFKREKYDIVHANMNALSFIPLSVAKKCSIPVRISHSHSTSHKKEGLRHIVKQLLRPFSKRYATHYFACSEKAGRWLYGDKAFDSNKVTIINNAIDFEKYSFNEDVRKEIRNSLNIGENQKVIGHIGRFMSQKNHVFLLEIFQELQKFNPNTVLLLVGNGERFDEIKNFVSNKGIKNVIFTGSVPNTSAYYQAMDCFCLPSLYEGLPVVGVEAQANGLKCFFSSEITKEAAINKQTQFLDLASGAKKWAEEINEFLIKDKLRCSSGLDNKFNIKFIADDLLRLYTEIVKW